jgi:hypothetical protein
MQNRIEVYLIGDKDKSRAFVENTLNITLEEPGFHDNYIKTGKLIKKFTTEKFNLTCLFRISELKKNRTPLNLNFFNVYRQTVGNFSKNCAVLFLDPDLFEKEFGNQLISENNGMAIDFDEAQMDAGECLDKIEELMLERFEKSLLILKGSKDKGSFFANIPYDVAKLISFINYNTPIVHFPSLFISPSFIQDGPEPKKLSLLSHSR